jgi:sialate O-acetylesterase
MRLKKQISTALICCTLFVTNSIFANVKLPTPFSDHMVIQHNTAVPVWGWADAVSHRFFDK